MYKLFKGNHCGQKTSSALYYFHVETVAHHINQIIAGNSIGKFRLSVENFKNRILHIPKKRLDLECLVQHSTDRCPIGMPNS